MRVIIFLFFICSICVIAAPASFANPDQELERLLATPLEDLTVSAASKRDEKISDAPSIISVLNRQDIARYGGTSINDVLARMPSLFMAGSAIVTNNTPSIRGQTTGQYSNHTLILLNGRPVRDGIIGFSASFLKNMPVSIVERIEVIRGPGSVLYGSNAFSGVINIVTLDPQKNGNQRQISAGIGTQNTFETAGHWVHQFSNTAAMTLAGKAGDTNGWRYQAKDITNGSGTYDTASNNSGFYSDVRYGHFTGSAYVGSLDYKAQGGSLIYPAADYKFNDRFFDLQYKKPLSGSWQTTSNVTFNGLSYAYANRQSITSAETVLYETNASGNVTESLFVLLGGSLETKALHYETETRSDNTYTASYYTQADYVVTDWLKITGGMQINDPEKLKRYYSPRLGAVLKPFAVENMGFKILYGEAFRNPGTERTVNLPQLRGNPNLKPERIKTTDLQFFYEGDKSGFTVTYYNSKQEDTITQSIVSFAPLLSTFNNFGTIEYHGIEVEGKKRWFDDRFELTGSLLLQENEDTTQNIADVGLIGNTLAKIGMSYQIHPGIMLGGFHTYMSKPARFASSAPINPDPTSFHILDSYIAFDINTLTGKESGLDMRFDITGHNLLGERVDFPEAAVRAYRSNPILDERHVLARLTVTF